MPKHPSLTHVLGQALREDRDVRLEESEHGVAIVVDGAELLDNMPIEMFECPVDRLDLDENARDLADELLHNWDEWAKKHRRDRERRRTATHRAAEGGSL